MVGLVDVDARTDARWHDLVDRAGGSLFHGRAWASVLAGTYGFAPRAVLLLDGDRAVSGIPWCLVADPGGRRVVSLPFSDYCGPIGAPPFELLLDELLAREVPVRYRVVVDADADGDATCIDGFRTTARARWHGIPIGDAPEQDNWPELHDSTRRAVAKARRDGVTVVERLDAEFVGQFLHLHTGVRKYKYGLLPQPRAFFDAMRAQYSETGDWHPLTAVQDGELLAATVYLRHGDTLYYKFNASDPYGLGARPNDVLLWAGIELAAKLGCRLVDLGASDDDQPGLIRFKRGFGAVEREIRTQTGGPPTSEAGATFREVLGDVTALLAAPDVPDSVTEDAGARLYRYFA